MLLRALSSLRLTLTLLLGLAVIAIAGTLKPAADGRYELFYQSPWFRFLLGLLAVNLLVCTLRTIRRNLTDCQRDLETLGSEQVFASPLRYLLPRELDPGRLATLLRQQGFRVCEGDGALLGRRGIAGRWGSTMVHLSFLAVMAGALAAEAGFVGTLNIYVGDKSSTMFDWDRQADRPLGFDFRLDYFEPRFYPIELRFAAVHPQTGEILATITAREGEIVPLPVPGVTARVTKFLPFEEQLFLQIFRDGIYLGDYVAFSGRNPQAFENSIDPGVILRPLAYRDPVLQQLHSEVSILQGGKVVRQGVIEINRPLEYEGVTIYQTAFDRDKFGLYFAGFQFTRDPGEPVVWAGCITLTLGLLLAFAVPYRSVGVSFHGGQTLLVALSGFRGEAGSAAFDCLERAIAEAAANGKA